MIEETEPIPQHTLYSKKAIGVGTFIGGPLAATILLSSNFSTLGAKGKRNITLIIGISITAYIMWLSMSIETSPLDSIPNSVFPLIISFTAYYITENLQGKALRNHNAIKGRNTSNWATFAWSMFSMIVTLGIAYCFVLLLPPYYFENNVYKEGLQGNKIYHDEYVETSTLRDFGQYLIESEYFDNQGYGVIQLTTNDDGYTIQFPYPQSYWSDRETMESIKSFGKGIQIDLLKQPLTVMVVDEDFHGTYRKTLIHFPFESEPPIPTPSQ